MTATSITLSGAILGRNWYGQECWKDFEVKFSSNEHEPFARHWTGMLDALLHITNDGDFAHCGVCNLSAKIDRVLSASSGRVTVKTVYAEIEPCKAIEDLFCEDTRTFEDFDD